MTAPDPSSVRHDGPWRHVDVHSDGIRLHAAMTGPVTADAPLVVLLHGYGTYWWTWRHQLTGLAALGYRVAAVDLRGYGDSDKPPRGYDGWTLAADVAGLIRGLGHDEAVVVGHGDGGLVGWATALIRPGRVRALITIGAPHPLVLRRAVLRDRRQRRAVLGELLADQLPRLAERRLTRDDGAGTDALLARRAGDFADDPEFAGARRRYRSAAQIVPSAHCRLEYHRWAFRSQFRPDGRRFRRAMRRRTTAPVLQIRGTADPYVLPHIAARVPAGLSVEQAALDAGHFVHEQLPAETTAVIADFLRTHRCAPDS